MSFDKKYQIFISSTYLDLVNERSAVIETILRLKHIPVGMENFNASNQSQWGYIEDVLRTCDYYIVIVGHRYGNINPETGISYTEMEFDFAKSLGIPILGFVIDKYNAPPLPMGKRESHEHEEKLQQFIAKVRDNRLNSAAWTNPHHLASLVSPSLQEQMSENPQTGWIRGNMYENKVRELQNELERLHRQNQSLQNQLASQPSNRKPNFEILLNDNNDALKLDFQNVLVAKERHEKINYDEVPEHLLKYITEEQVEEYNQNLPSPEEVAEYNQTLKTYTRVQEARTQLKIEVSNIGNQAAEQIYVDITLPPELLVIKKGEEVRWEKPKRPNWPHNPLRKANSQYQKELFDPIPFGIGDSLGGIAAGSFEVAWGNKQIPGLRSIFSVPSTDRPWNIRVDNNQIRIRIDSLMHYRSLTLSNEVEIIPLEQGTYEISVEVICKELEEPIKYTVPVIVEKTN